MTPSIVLESIREHRSYSSYRSIIKRHWPLLDLQLSTGPYAKYSENLYLFLNELQTRPLCMTCKTTELAYKDRTIGYGKYCSLKCSANSNDVKQQHHNNHALKSNQEKQKIVNKRKDTMRKRYGVEYALQDPKKLAIVKEKYRDKNPTDIQNKKQLTIKQRYGVDNIWQLSSVRDRIKLSNLEKYGVEWVLQHLDIINQSKNTKNTRFYNDLCNRVANASPLFSSDEFVGVDKKYLWKCNTCFNEFNDHIDDGSNPICPYCFPVYSTVSKGESELVEFIFNDLLITDIIQNTKDIIFPKEIDIFLPDHNVAIEYNGLYWHSENKIVDTKYHQKKYQLCRDKNITLLQIFEDEWLNDNAAIKLHIKHLLSTNHKQTNNTVKFIEQQDFESALKFTLTISKSIASVYIGEFKDGTLTSAIGFGQFTVDNWEIIQTTVIGTESYKNIFEFFINSLKPKSVKVVSDNRHGLDNIYYTLGMQYVGSKDPTYWYTKNGITRFHHLDIELFENQSDYYKVWDAGYNIFIWTR